MSPAERPPDPPSERVAGDEVERTGEDQPLRLFDLDRTIAFSDAVIAIAITLLVLAINPPELAGAVSSGELLDAIWDQRTKFIGFAVSFYVIARFWLVHHRFCGYLRAFDGTLLSLNLFFLALIAVVPYPTDLYGDYNGNPVALSALAVVIAAASGVSVAMHAYARGRGLMTPEAERFVGPGLTPARVVVPFIFLLAVPIAFFVSAEWAPLTWALLAFMPDRDRPRKKIG